ncbi:beta-lactamase [Aureococcus anophagefferens]|nr:beta-lactamase [Aureococcus anophagefferens]
MLVGRSFAVAGTSLRRASAARGLASLEYAVEALLGTYGVAGVSAAVLAPDGSGGAVVRPVVGGLASRARREPVAPGTLFQIASLSKPVATAFAIDFFGARRLLRDGHGQRPPRGLRLALPAPERGRRAAGVGGGGALGSAGGLGAWLGDLAAAFRRPGGAGAVSAAAARSMLADRPDLGSRAFMRARVGRGVFLFDAASRDAARPNRWMLHQAANDGFRGFFLVCFDGPSADGGPAGLVVLCNGDNGGVLFNCAVARALLASEDAFRAASRASTGPRAGPADGDYAGLRQERSQPRPPRPRAFVDPQRGGAAGRRRPLRRQDAPRSRAAPRSGHDAPTARAAASSRAAKHRMR